MGFQYQASDHIVLFSYLGAQVFYCTIAVSGHIYPDEWLYSVGIARIFRPEIEALTCSMLYPNFKMLQPHLF